jgi:uncharacterized LabA/DUF88 family protein
MSGSMSKVGVYVDGANVAMNGGWGMRYDVLREFAARDCAEVVRLNAYLSFDPERAERDDVYRRGQESFHSSLRDMGYKVIRKHIRYYLDESGKRYGKANVDLDMAVEALLQSEHLDRVVLVTGDGDFVRVVRALQNKGCRVEILAFDNVSRDLRREADMFMPGYLVPNLQPTTGARDLPPWGEMGSRVRGVCYNHTGKGYGFLRYIHRLRGDLWITDSRHPDSPYKSVFFHDSSLPDGVSYLQLPTRELIFEFELKESPTGSGNGLQTSELQLVGRVRGHAEAGRAGEGPRGGGPETPRDGSPGGDDDPEGEPAEPAEQIAGSAPSD